MARTKSSRGGKPFQMRSPETPYPFLGKIGKGIGKLAKSSPIGQMIKALKGKNDPNTAAEGAVSGVGGDAQTTLDAIKELVSDDGTQGLIGATEDTALTKKVD